MSKLQSIENAIASLNGAVFQELCDSFLSIRNNNYSAFSRTGSQSGKQKTIKGTPDTFLLLPNGKFIFVEYSTNITSGIKKLKEDVIKCIDSSKTGIPINQISEIILCLNFNLTTNDIQTIKNLLKNTRILLSLYTLDSLSIEIKLNHRDLAYQYLGIALDSGQIVSIENFIREYNRASKGIATPLDNKFLHREIELKELLNAIDNHDFIILTGAPGVGKTKLAIEAIDYYLTNNKIYNAYCVSYKNYNLLDDLYQYFDKEKDYLLFVDDGNRIDAFEQITGFFKANRKGNLKIIITVRDYAFQEIIQKCQEFSVQRIDINKFKDEQIIDIIKSKPFEILNSEYHELIVRISEGNPRLAIMASLLAKKENNLEALRDVSDLFERYFSTFINDDGEFKKTLNIKCLGIIAFFYTIPYKIKKITKPVLKKFNINYNDFIDTIDILDKLELVEIQFEHVKIPEQNLATFFFYKAFIKENLLSFQILLKNYFEIYPNRFADTIIPANNTFGPQNVMDKVKPDLIIYRNLIRTDVVKTYDFLNSFWYYLQNETLEFAYKKIESLPEIKEACYSILYEKNKFNNDKDALISLLSNFFRVNNNYIKDSIELLFSYVRRKPDKLGELIKKIRELLIFDRNDERYGFYRQKKLFNFLIDNLNKDDKLISISFYELSKTFLSFKFQQFKGGRNNTFTHYQYPIPNNNIIRKFRKSIWNALEENYNYHPQLSFDLLINYSRIHPSIIKEIMEFDIPFILRIIDVHLSRDNFEHCKYVHNQIRWFKRQGINLSEFSRFEKKFINETYSVFLKINWDRYRDKEIYDFDNYQEYERLKEKEIRTSFIFNTINELNKFYNIFILLGNSEENNWKNNNALDFIIDENCSINFTIGLEIFKKIIENGNEIKYVPRNVFKNHLKLENTTNQIWKIIQQFEFKLKELWELSFYEYIDDSLINSEISLSLIKTVSKMKNPNSIHFDRLERFLRINPNLFQIILKTITEKNELEGTKIQVWIDFFSKYFNNLGDDIELIKKAYIQQYQFNNHFDYQGNGFLEILKIDESFLLDFVNNLYSDKFSLHGDYNDMSYVWSIENIEKILIQVFELVIEKEDYFGILEHFCNVFFRNFKDQEHEKKANDFIRQYVVDNNHDYKKMEIVVDLIRHSRKELFEEIFLLFISLNQDKEVFEKLMWRGNGGSYSGNVIIGDIQAAEWRNLLEITKKSNLGFKLIPIKNYLNEQIESCLRRGNKERERRFLERF
ncbi:hypothetical protein [Tenacibaculum aiptasiae]|uniref:nSTAND3 domain-containing NTPase n=1 Tax=Tenacibaculum aiptasiae TaxID=426481 RepID=UPI003B5AABA3